MLFTSPYSLSPGCLVERTAVCTYIHECADAYALLKWVILNNKRFKRLLHHVYAMQCEVVYILLLLSVNLMYTLYIHIGRISSNWMQFWRVFFILLFDTDLQNFHIKCDISCFFLLQKCFTSGFGCQFIPIRL